MRIVNSAEHEGNFEGENPAGHAAEHLDIFELSIGIYQATSSH